MSVTEFVHGQILHGDVLEKLKEIPAESIDCVITSPPYWGLRDYKIEGQWGLEPDFHEYLEKMQKFMDMVKIVLKKTGTCWINLGDTYAGGVTHSDFSGLPKELARPWNEGHRFKSEHKKNHIQAKSQYGIPQRFYADCIDNGWIARNFIPWIKENSMPNSVKDRFTNKWEPVMFFVKQQKYYFNLDAVREKPKGETKPFNLRVRDAKKGLGIAKMGDLSQAWKMSDQENRNYNEKGERKQDVTLGADGKPLAHYKGFNHRWKTGSGFDENGNCFGCGLHYSKHTSQYRALGSLGEQEKRTSLYTPCNPKGKNPGDVFRINPRPFPEAHFATFPVDLPLFILKCGCPLKVCSNCEHMPLPIKKPTENYQKILDDKPWTKKGVTNKLQVGSGLNSIPDYTHNYSAEYIIVGYTKCECNATYKPGVVLDPFFGAGTVGLAAEKLALNWKGIELSEEYIKIAKKRLEPHNFSRIDDFY